MAYASSWALFDCSRNFLQDCRIRQDLHVNPNNHVNPVKVPNHEPQISVSGSYIFKLDLFLAVFTLVHNSNPLRQYECQRAAELLSLIGIFRIQSQMVLHLLEAVQSS